MKYEQAWERDLRIDERERGFAEDWTYNDTYYDRDGYPVSDGVWTDRLLTLGLEDE